MYLWGFRTTAFYFSMIFFFGFWTGASAWFFVIHKCKTSVELFNNIPWLRSKTTSKIAYKSKKEKNVDTHQNKRREPNMEPNYMYLWKSPNIYNDHTATTISDSICDNNNFRVKLDKIVWNVPLGVVHVEILLLLTFYFLLFSHFLSNMAIPTIVLLSDRNHVYYTSVFVSNLNVVLKTQHVSTEICQHPFYLHFTYKPTYNKQSTVYLKSDKITKR